MPSRSAEKIPGLVRDIAELCAGQNEVSIMEVCGTHTVSLFRSGVKSMLPENLRLISGPGCPVCVTAQGYIDAACALAAQENRTLCTYGDMVRVPGQAGSLAMQRARGADVRVVYSPRDALLFAAEHPEREVLFLAVGFETTTPTTAAILMEAEARRLSNFWILPGHKRVLPALETLLADKDAPIQGFLCPGHVSVILGAEAYRPIVKKYGKPCVVTGFEPAQMLEGIRAAVRQICEDRAEVENVYGAAVSAEGNRIALDLMERVFEPADAVWRAMGMLPSSGDVPRDDFAKFDGAARFDVDLSADYENPGCLCGAVIQGKATPLECPLFGGSCTPVQPVGPCMVSSEGTCAAYYKYGRNPQKQ